MLFQDRVRAFHKLSKILAKPIKHSSFNSIIEKAENNNSWFTKDYVQYSFRSIGYMLDSNKLETWLSNYMMPGASGKKIGVIIPSNIPLVGFYDFFCVLLSGNIFIGKLSLSNSVLLPFIAELLYDINPEFKNYIFFTNDLSNIDLLIATGDNNSADYFNYLYVSVPKIVRKHRNSICVLDGSETKCDYYHLMNDLLMYYGLGCRNVSKIYLPNNFDVTIFQPYLENYFKEKISRNYIDNYVFQKTNYTLSEIDFLDCGHTLLTESTQLNSPVGVIYYEYYNNLLSLKKSLKINSDIIQCVVSNSVLFDRTISFGRAQMPNLHDFPDGLDVMRFICSN